MTGAPHTFRVWSLATALGPATTRKADMQTLLLIPVNGGEPRELVKLERKGYQLTGGFWAPDSLSFYYGVTGSDEPLKELEIWQVPIDGGVAHKLPVFEPGHNVAVHPDGRQIAFQTSQSPAQPEPIEVWVLENFLPAAKGAPAAK
jgi:Tol biopolymer transport system component